MIPAVALLAAIAAPQFPAPFVGRWSDIAGGCEEGAIHGGLTIGPSDVQDGEASADLTRVVRKTRQSIDVVLQWDDEDETARMTYRLSNGGTTLTAHAVGTQNSQLLHRCGVKR